MTIRIHREIECIMRLWNLIIVMNILIMIEISIMIKKARIILILFVRCLIFCTYDDKKFNYVADCLSLTDIGSDLRIFSDREEIESLFRNKFISESLRLKIEDFKKVTDEVDEEEWFFESLDLSNDERWKKINIAAEDLLTEMNIKERDFDFALYVPR